jgi:hypothetical protein
VQRFRIGLTVAVVGALAALALASCGDNSTTTIISTTPAPATSTPTSAPTTTTPKPTTSTAAPTTTTSTASGPGSCGSGQAYSQVSHTCVDTNSQGNPCPKGQVPMADRPICVPKD